MVPLLPALSVVVLSALLPHGPNDARARERGSVASVLALKACPAGALCIAVGNGPDEHAAPSPLREEDLPWCVSADDPRCAPLHTDAGRLGSDTTGAFTASPPCAQSAPLSPSRSETRTPRSGLAPRLGVSHRVERPPRGGAVAVG